MYVYRFLDDEFGDLDFSGKGKSKKVKSATTKSMKKLVLQFTFSYVHVLKFSNRE